MLAYLIFIINVVYIIVSNILESKSLLINIAMAIGIGLIPIVNIIKNRSISSILLLIATIIIGVFTCIDRIDKNENETDGDIFSIVLFTITGIIAYFINSFVGESCSSDNGELLCNKKFIIIFILFSYGIFKSLSTLRIKGMWPFSDDNSTTKSMNTINIVLLSLWQLYIYILIDGFRDGEFSYKQLNGGSSASMYKLFSYMSLFILSGFFITNLITYSECNVKSEYINKIKEIQYNLLVSTIVTLVLIFLMSG